MTTPGTFFRSAVEADIGVLADIEKNSFQRPWSRSSLLAELAADGAVSRVACERDKVPVAYLLVRRIVDEIHIMRIAVRRDRRRQGLAASLMQEVIAIAKQTDTRSIILEVRPSNEAAIGLYQNLGFTLWGQRKKYYPESGEDALIMGYTIKEDL